MVGVRCGVLWLAAGLLLAGGITSGQAAWAAERGVGDDKVVELVDERLDGWWLKPDEKRFDLIGWAVDIRTAKELAAEHERPVFLFTMDGRVNTGRC